MLYDNTDMRIEGRLTVWNGSLFLASERFAIILFFFSKLSHRLDVFICHVNQGFDEYMNVVLDDAEELSIKKKTRTALGMHASSLLTFVWVDRKIVIFFLFRSCTQ
jgi:hypothetical protein